MNISELSNEFDVLYNNIMSNAAPGLNEYEKSVFLTKALNEIIFNHFNPKGNKYQEGFDNSPKRLIDFSELITQSGDIAIGITASKNIGGILFTAREAGAAGNSINITTVVSASVPVTVSGSTITLTCPNNTTIEAIKILLNANSFARYFLNVDKTVKTTTFMTAAGPTALTGGTDSAPTPFDARGKVFVLPNNVLLILNETYAADGVTYRVVPIDFQEYDRVMSKPFKEPFKYQVWRLIKDGTTAGIPNVEIIPHSGTVTSAVYSVRYVKRPQPIILTDLTGVYTGLTIDGISAPTECELNPIVHREILDRAVELAKAAYTGELTSIVQLNQRGE